VGARAAAGGGVGAATRAAPTRLAWCKRRNAGHSPRRPQKRRVRGKAANQRRRSLRLKGYDYAQAGAYFVTVCTQDRTCLFGDVAGDTVCLNAAGQLAATLWSAMPTRFPEIELDAFVVMPNHVHGVIVLPDRAETVGAPLVGAHADDGAERAATRAAPTVGNVVGGCKSLFTVEYIQGVKEGRWPRFQGRV
jgi:putative transposase